tara:strand:+ start:3441 stop:3950 length:510 start_codon:yes stop_codon:yes gene_type:complete
MSGDNENTKYKNYFDEETEKQKVSADAQLRKGYYNGEKYHRTQETTSILMIVYYITAVVFSFWFLFRGAYKGMSISMMMINAFLIIIMPYIFYYYLVDLVTYLFDYLTSFVTGMSVNNLIAFVATILIGIYILSSIFIAPLMSTLTPIIITFSGFLVILGILLRSTFLA